MLSYLTATTLTGIPDAGTFRDSDRRVTVGIVGSGDVVHKSHLPTLLALPHVDVAWVADANAERAERTARSYGLTALALPPNPAEFPTVDVVLLAIPYSAREPFYDAGPRWASAMYVEKPLARTAAEHSHLCSLFAPSHLTVGLQRRAWGTGLLLRRFVAESTFGQLHRVSVRHGEAGLVTSGKTWIHDPGLAGGGVLFEHGIHSLDLALHIVGATQVADFVGTTIIQHGFDVHADGTVSMFTPTGIVTLDFRISWLEHLGSAMSFYFEHAVVEMVPDQPGLTVRSLGGKRLFDVPLNYQLLPMTGVQTLASYWSTFLMGMRTDATNFTAAAESLLTTRLLETIILEGRGR